MRNQTSNVRPSEYQTMKHHTLRSLGRFALLAALVAWGSVGCIEPGPRINRVQTNLIDKSVFEGEWWFTHTTIGLDDSSAWAVGQAGASAPWPGATANFDLASQSGVVGRIRWVVDENVLYAFRSTEIVQGSSADARDPGFRGQPLAAYRIQGHFDVRQDFSSVTGEPGNVVSENTDRRWYDRQFVRVDWSQNLVTWGLFGSNLEIEELFGTFRRESAPLGITDPGNCPHPEDPNSRCDLPAEWAPQFVRVSDERPCADGSDVDGACYRFFEEWPADQRDSVHYMSFVTQELWTPQQCFGNTCNTSIAITVRDAFLRIPPQHEYAVETLSNSEYDRFGIIRTESRTYLRGGLDRSTLGRHCVADTDCDPGCDPAVGPCELVCDTAQQVCVGGLSNELGETDYLTYYRLRHNFYSDSLTDQECIADWQCSGRYDGAVSADGRGGSVCDQHARRCTIPAALRPIRSVHYTLTPSYPTYLVRSAFELVGRWNVAFMEGARQQREGRADDRFGGAATPPPPTGMPVACQGADPTQYCYCNEGFISPEVNPDTRTCTYQTNLFVRPEERGEENPYQCWIEGPADLASPEDFSSYDVDADGNGKADVYGYRFVGPECMLVLDVNACDHTPGQACQQLGDLRYQFFNYVSAAASGFCGVMQPNQDPVTGEAIISPINMGGQCLDSISQQAINIWPILRGEESADPLLRGEEIRRYFENLGRVRAPIGLAPGTQVGAADGGARPALPADLLRHFEDNIASNLANVRDLHGAEGRARILSDRLGEVRGTGLEHRLVDGVAGEVYGALANRPADAIAARQLGSVGVPADLIPTGGATSSVSDAVLDRVSPFRDGMLDEMQLDRARQQALESTGTCMLYDNQQIELISQYGEYWANAFAGRPLAEARIRWAQAWHRAVMQHELGHGLGLEHNFAGTLDRDQYMDGYFRLEDENPLPRMEDFDADRNGVITDLEANTWLEAFQTARRTRNEAGMGNWTSSSTMDYPGDLSDIMQTGRYDRAAVFFNYFNMIEAYTGGDPTQRDPSTSRDGLLRSDQHGRELFTWYRGGEQCTTDAQCPFAAGSAGLAPGQVVTQRCVSNPRYSSIPVPCGDIDDPEAASHCVCSDLDNDMVDYVDAVAYRDPASDLEYYPVQYLFCSNSRLDDISWCNVFDAGETFVEVLANMRTSWESSYPTSYFRRFRRPFSTGSRALRWIPDAAKIYQHLLFRYFYEPRFRSDNGPLGFEDQFMASVDAMNFFSYLAQLPDVGSYSYDATTNSYRHMGETSGMAGSDFSLEPGQGFYTWSAFQDTSEGFFRLERVGTFYDKLLALRALTIRDWGLNFTIDERYFINFHDFFPVEMTELFGGYILDDPHWFAPRVSMDGGRPTIEYLNWYRGTCRNPSTGQFEPCRGPNQDVFPGRPLDGTSNDVLRVYASIFALAEFPVYYDTSWEDRLSVFRLGNGDGWDFPDTQTDGSTTCAYVAPEVPVAEQAEFLAEPGHALCVGDAAGADYIVYRSDRLHVEYVATKVRPRIDYNLEEEQLGFQLLLEMTNNQEAIRTLEALAVRTPAQEAELNQRRRTLERNESFLETLVEVQRIFGITSFL